MGVYSNLAAQRINEASMLETFEYTDLLEFAINIERSNQAMFDAMLEMDFHEAYAAKGLISINEAGEEAGKKSAIRKIIDKIVETIKKFISTVKVFFTKLRNNISELIGHNKRLVEKFGTLDKTEVLAAIKDRKIEVTIVKSDFDNIKNAGLEKITKLLDKQDHVTEAESKAVVDQLISDLGDTDKFFEKSDLKEAIEMGKLDVVGLRKKVEDSFSSQVKDAQKEFENIIGKFEEKIKKYEDLAKADSTEDADREKYNTDIKFFNQVIVGIYKVMNIIKIMVTKYNLVYRSLYAKCGTLVGKKGGNEEKKPEQKKPEENKPKENTAKTSDGKGEPGDADHDEEGNAYSNTAEFADLTFQFGAIDIMNETFIENLFS